MKKWQTVRPAFGAGILVGLFGMVAAGWAKFGAAQAAQGAIPQQVYVENKVEASVPVQVALLRPYSFPFREPTSLEEVVDHLKQKLKAPVVLDLAALKRKEVEPTDTVRLELEGVRLQTGLKLLLD